MNHNTQLAGIVNITPDSFSDGGEAFAPDAALKHASRLLQDGADILDIGAESTRPGATPLSHEEEWARLAPILPAITAMARTYPAKISIDTRHPLTASRALEVGADWINDVSGFTNPEMIEAVKKSDCPLVVMHSLSIPADPHVVLSSTSDIINDIATWFIDTKERLSAQGIDEKRLICDPGIGFGKSAAQSLTLVSCAGQLKDKINAPLYIGHSRKSFAKTFAGDDMGKRDMITCAFSSMLMLCNINYLRVHDVAAHSQLRKMLLAA